VAADAALRIDGSTTAVAAADVNKDSFPDFFFGGESAPGTFALSDGRGRFVTKPGPAASAGATAARFFDYDNDGLLDLLTWSADGPHLFRQVSDGWTDVTTRALGGLSPSRSGLQAQALALADVDGDGDMDVIVANGDRIDWWRNDGGSRHPSVRVRLAGRASNHDGIGAKVDVRAGSLRQRLESSSASPAVAPADLVFGLGRRGRADVVRVLWPSGILQAETSITAPMLVSELDRKPSSCPFLFAWNGRAFGFVTDFLGGGEMGYWEGPGVRNTPDPDEYVRIRGDQLQPKDGRYELRVTNELEEGVFLDRVQLLGVSHPRDVEIFPNEGMTDPPKPFRVFAVSNLRPPLQAVDEHGHDVTSRIAERDRRYVDDFVLERFRGYAATHTLALKLPEPVARGLSRAPVLLLTGWTDYAFSSDNVAAHQAGLALQPPRLEIKTADGSWRTLVADIGIPVGRPQTIVVDLTAVAQAFPPPLAGGELRRGSPKRQRREGGRPAESIELRVVTNMRIYWDQILIGDRDESRVRIDRMDPIEAHLRSRGFSAEVHPDGLEPASYDYDRVTRESPWKVLPGRYTREGDVLPLLTRVDDRFVVSQPGDEVVLSFDARLAPLPDGWTRTFLLYADGFSKEMDINSSSPDLLAPLPFHGMVAYPYASPQRRGDEFREYLDRYNTRIVARPIPSMDKPDKP
jgi:hypothetical protein